MASMVLKVLEQIKEKIESINPAFIGHVKISLSLGKDLVKGSLTSSQGQPLVEIFDSSGQDHEHLKFLSAVTQVSKSDLMNIIDSAIHSNLERAHVRHESVNQNNNLIRITGNKP